MRWEGEERGEEMLDLDCYLLKSILYYHHGSLSMSGCSANNPCRLPQDISPPRLMSMSMSMSKHQEVGK